MKKAVMKLIPALCMLLIDALPACAGGHGVVSDRSKEI